MSVLWGLILAVISFIVLNLFLPAGWAALLAVVVFLVVAFGGSFPQRV